jgi:hypothetical protein
MQWAVEVLYTFKNPEYNSRIWHIASVFPDKETAEAVCAYLIDQDSRREMNTCWRVRGFEGPVPESMTYQDT